MARVEYNLDDPIPPVRDITITVGYDEAKELRTALGGLALQRAGNNATAALYNTLADAERAYLQGDKPVAFIAWSPR